MAALTPIDLVHRQQQFAGRKSVDGEDVAQFLETVREAWEGSLREIAALRDELRARDTTIGQLVGREDEIRETLVLARRMALDLENTARREADVLVGEARLEAERLVAAAQDDHRAVQEDVLRLKAARLHHLAQMRALLDAQARMLDELDPRA
jgi:cell division initiation protein